MKIAIDGPAGAGKSTVAKAIAQKLDIIYLDTGAMYRATALYMLKNGIEAANTEAVKDALSKIDIEIKYQNGAQKIYLSGKDVSQQIRQNHISAAASLFSSLQPVREFLVFKQQQIAQKQDCILDGRDIGTCVLPDADYKFFLTASIEVRAKRRHDELEAKGENVSLQTLEEEIAKRDYDDSHRKISPLRQANDAVLIDSSNMTAQQVTDYIISCIKGE